jgi:hypothetical protein
MRRRTRACGRAFSAKHEAAALIGHLLRRVPFPSPVRVVSARSRNDGIDLIVSLPGGPRLMFAVIANGQPGFVRRACLRLRDAIGFRKRRYSMLIAPYLSNDAAAICTETDVD